MIEFTFEYPEVFAILILYIICLLFCKEKVTALYFTNLNFFGIKRSLFNLTTIFKHLSFLALVTTLASPVIIDKFDPKNRVGIDIVLSIDVSGSMKERGFDRNQKDISRFEAVKDVAKEFVKMRTDDNIGVVFFGDFAFINAPLTYEKDVLIELIDFIELGIAGENTALGDGIAMAIKSFKSSKARAKVMILLTDGRDNLGKIKPKEATLLAKSKEIKIYTIGIGKEEDFDTSMLKYIASETGGEFFSVADKHLLKKVYSHIDELEESNIKARDYLKKEYYFIYPLSFAILFLGLFIIFRYRSYF